MPCTDSSLENAYPFVSVVIPTSGRRTSLRRCLGALAHQSYPAEMYEVVVIIDNGAQGAGGFFEQALDNTDLPAVLLWSQLPGKGPAAARNFGWRAACGEVVAFTDDDTVPDPGWLANGVRALTPEFAAVGGRTIVPVPDRPTDYQRNVHRLEQAGFITANCFYWRSWLERVDGFDERFRDAYREDIELVFRINETGGAIGDAPSAIVYHPVGPAPFGISLKLQQRSQYEALLYGLHPARYRAKYRVGAPRNYYVIVGAFLAGLSALIARRPRVAGILLGLSLAVDLDFFRTRTRGASRSPKHLLEMFLTSLAIPFLSLFWRAYGTIRYRVLRSCR